MSSKACVLFLLCIVSCVKNAKGLLLFPSEEAVVCEGEQLELTCSTNVSILQWTSSPLQTEQGSVQTLSRSSSTDGPSKQASTMMVNSTLFRFSRVSPQDEFPLVSRLVISPVSDGLNGTEVNCTERVINNENTAMASTTINVVGLIPNHPKINASVTVVKYGANDVTVLLRWTPWYTGATYNVSIVTAEPKAASMNFTMLKNSQTTVAVLYNTHYNVCIKAIFCGQKSVSTVFEIHYGVCNYPFERHNRSWTSSTTVMGSTKLNPALEGTSIVLHCPPEQTLVGPESIICMENGEWEPDPRIARCNDALNTTSSTMCASEEDSHPHCNGILIGTLVGLGSLCLIIIIIAVIIILKWKRSKRSVCTINRDSRNNQQKEEVTLIYADIGPATVRPAQSSASISLDLDDSHMHVQYAQINLKMLVQEPSKSKEPHAESERKDDRDNVEVNLDNVLIQLRAQVSPIWYQFGEAAGIETEILDNLADNCSPQECIVEMLDYWLRKQKKSPTWRDIANILKIIKLERLATEIEKVYTTGKLPVEVNTNNIILNDHEASQEFDTKLEASDTPPPIPPKRMEVDCGVRDFDHQNSRTKPKSMKPPPPLPSAEALPTLPPKIKANVVPVRPPKP